MPPPKGRKNPELLLGPDGDVQPSPEEREIESEIETEVHYDAGDPGQPDQVLIYDGEVLISGMTLAVVLPGDERESYFPAKFIARKQPGESEEMFASRVITVVRDTALGQIDDAIDSLAEYQAQLAASGRIPSA